VIGRTEGDLISRHDYIAFAGVKYNLWKKYENEIIGKWDRKVYTYEMQLIRLQHNGCKLLPQCGINPDHDVLNVEDGCTLDDDYQNNLPIIRNLVQDGTSLQDSTYDRKTSNKAIDGNTNGDYSKGSVTHTKFERYAWWRVKLASTSLITKIKVYNRSDAVQDCLYGAVIEIVDEYGNVVARKTLTKSNLTYVETFQRKQDIWIFSMFFGSTNKEYIFCRSVRIYKNGFEEYLSLAEVEVYGAYPVTVLTFENSKKNEGRKFLLDKELFQQIFGKSTQGVVLASQWCDADVIWKGPIFFRMTVLVIHIV